MQNAPRGNGALAVDDRAEVQKPTVAPTTDKRPRCAVVGVYCEALGWLRREPGPPDVCCRHYWADAEVA